jgi:hypothetical protein
MAADETDWRDAALLTAALGASAVGLYGGQGVLEYFDISGLSGVPSSVFAAPFGLLVGGALFEQWGPAAGLAIVSIPAFWAASQITGNLAGEHIPLLATHETGFAFLVGSVVGALIMAGALAYWRKPSVNRFVLSAIAGAVAAFGFVTPWSSHENLAVGFVVWQVLVGWALVGRLSSGTYARSVRNRRIASVGAAALVIGVVGFLMWPS